MTPIQSAVYEDLKTTFGIIPTDISEVTGGYSGNRKHLVTVSFTMRQYSELISVINKADKSAFVTVHSAHEINGEGWTR